ncbi:MAG: hypothetical protein PHC61_05585 [Chitinivibrionales bacterium]|nr:hypothetical protein [Chitinivibrionales bacterium]
MTILNRIPRRISCIAAFIAIAVCLNVVSVFAATITWGTPAYVKDSSDVSTTGTLKYAYSWSGQNVTINGVTFTGTLSAGNVGASSPYNLVLASNTSGWPGVGTFFRSPDGVTGQYATVFLPSAVFTDFAITFTITLNNLTSGHAYMLQIWSEDSYYNGGTATIVCGNSVTLSKNKTGMTGPGQYVIGTFTADGTAPVLTISGTYTAGADKAGVINGLQVREVTGTGVIATNKNIATTANNLQNARIYDLRGRLLGISENGTLPQSARTGIYILKSAEMAGKKLTKLVTLN